jgi:hypothetical protein
MSESLLDGFYYIIQNGKVFWTLAGSNTAGREHTKNLPGEIPVDVIPYHGRRFSYEICPYCGLFVCQATGPWFSHIQKHEKLGHKKNEL